MKPILKVFVMEHCSNCSEARALATHIAQSYPELAVQIIDIGQPQAIVPDEVFATPTFMLNRRVISLGNPYLEEIVELVEEAIVRPS